MRHRCGRIYRESTTVRSPLVGYLAGLAIHKRLVFNSNMSSAASAADAIARLNDSRALSADAPAVTLAGSATTFRFRAVIRGLASALYFLLPRQAERWTQLAVQYEVVAEKRSKCGGAIDAIRTLHRPGSSQLRRSRWRHHRKCVLAKQTQQPQIQYSVEPSSERP